MTFRTWGGDDVAFLWYMLYESLHVKDGAEPFPRSVLADPGIARYLADFGATTGDDAQICVGATGSLGSGQRGAAGCRWPDPGCGYVDDDTPELGMAVVAEWRGKGIGRRLLEDLLARNPSMSLSVDDENEGATALYRSIGFVPVGVVEQSTTMVRRLGLRRP